MGGGGFQPQILKFDEIMCDNHNCHAQIFAARVPRAREHHYTNFPLDLCIYIGLTFWPQRHLLKYENMVRHFFNLRESSRWDKKSKNPEDSLISHRAHHVRYSHALWFSRKPPTRPSGTHFP